MKMLKSVLYLGLGFISIMPITSSVEVIHGEDVRINGGLGINRAGNRPLRIKVPTNGTHGINLENVGGANVFQMTVDASGHGVFFVKDTTNTTKMQFHSTATTYFNNAGGVAIGSTGTGGNALRVTGNFEVQTGDAIIGNTLSAAVVEIRGAGNDLAETFKVNNEIDAIKSGMIVSIDPKNPGEMTLSTSAYDRKVAGVISGAGDLHAGIHLGDTGKVSEGFHPVALTGRVWCHVAPTSSPIAPGDMLTTSAIPGHTMKVADYAKAQGSIIGKAMTSVNKETGMVLVLVSLQ